VNGPRGPAGRACRPSPDLPQRLVHREAVVSEPRAVDEIIAEDALDVVARLLQRDELHPDDRVDGRVPRIAEGPDPLTRIAAAGVVGRGGEHQRAIEALEL